MTSQASKQNTNPTTANVQDVLRKYGAEYTVSCRDRWFRFTCAIPCAVHDMSTDNL